MLHISILGMGLIGTSLGMALRSAPEQAAPLGATAIIGYDSNPKATADARGRLAIDRQARTLEEAVREADLVVVAVPALAARAVFAEIAPLLRHGAIVTDVTSTKAQIAAWAAELLPSTATFVGGHPMAGSEQSGAHAASPDLFKDAIYCLTPTAKARPEAVQVLDAMVRQAGAKPYYLDPAEHDSYVAGVSHLPFLLSTALVQTTTASPSWREMATLAASGYRDISRLASGDVAMHRDICLTNREALLRWIDEASAWLGVVREQIASEDQQALLATFQQAKAARDQWVGTKPGRPGEDDFVSLSPPVERRGLLGLGPKKREQR